MNESDPHKVYQQKLREIGTKLGYETKGLDTPVKGWLDSVWRLKETCKFTKSDDYVRTYGLPIVAFEVIYSEKAKLLRGSLFNMISAKPSLGVFVFLKKARQQKYPNEDVYGTEEYIKNLCRKFEGLIRTEIWYQDDVDKLYEEVVAKDLRLRARKRE